MQRKQTEPQLVTYLHAKGGALGLPISGTFELTSRCNFNCPMCYVHNNDANGELSASQWISIASQAKSMGMVFVLLTGGEPFLRKDFFEIYKALKEMGLMISINTNGSLLSSDVLQKLIEDPPFRMNISLYGASTDTYHNMCKSDAFDDVINSITAIKNAGIDLKLNLSITPDNCFDMEKIYLIAKELDIHIKASSYMYPPVRINGQKFGCASRMTAENSAKHIVNWDKLRFSKEEFNQFAKEINKLSSVYQRECSADLDEGVGCRAGSSSFWITYDGKMTPCGMMPKPVAYPLHSGFSAAWDKIKQDTKNITLPSKCTVCKYRSVCAVCAAVCITETGDFSKVPEYVCKQTQEMVRLYGTMLTKGDI